MSFGPENQAVYDRFRSATATVTGTAAALPSHACGLVMLKAATANTQPITIGQSGVTAGAGWVLAAGASTPWIPISNVGLIYAIAASGSQTLEILFL